MSNRFAACQEKSSRAIAPESRVYRGHWIPPIEAVGFVDSLKTAVSQRGDGGFVYEIRGSERHAPVLLQRFNWKKIQKPDAHIAENDALPPHARQGAMNFVAAREGINMGKLDKMEEHALDSLQQRVGKIHKLQMVKK